MLAQRNALERQICYKLVTIVPIDLALSRFRIAWRRSRKVSASERGTEMSETNETAADAADETPAMSNRAADRWVGRIVGAYREGTQGVPIAETAAEDGHVDAQRGIVADGLAALAAGDRADAMARAAELTAGTLDKLEVWAGDPTAVARRRALAEHRLREEVRTMATRRMLAAGTVLAAELEAVTIREGGKRDAARIRAERTAENKRDAARLPAVSAVETARTPRRRPVAAAKSPAAVLAGTLAAGLVGAD